MVFRMLAVLNEFERDQISERTSTALQHKKARREANCRTPYGFDRIGKMLVMNHEEQIVLEEILTWRAQGMSYQSIADDLNRDNIPTKLGGEWHAAAVRSVVQTSGAS